MMGMKVKPSALREIIDEIDEDCWNLESSVSLLPSSWLKRMKKLSRKNLKR